MDMRKPKKSTAKLDKSPYDRRGEKITSKAFKSVEKSVKPVAKDTNKTRRKTTKARIVGDTVPTEKPRSNLKKVLSKTMRVKCC
jgi:hypothetical protein